MNRRHKSVKEVQDAFNAVRAAGRSLEGQIAKTFPVGSRVYWSHGDYQRSGTVLRTAFVNIQVEGQTSEYWVHAWRIDKVEEA